MQPMHEAITSKIVTSHEELAKILAVWRFKTCRIVFTNGCFDILHKGHIDYLAKAASFGDVFIVALNSDASVMRIKGDERPIQDEGSRSFLLAALQFVDKVILFDENTPYNLISDIKPDVLIKGDDYNPDDIVGADIVRANGGVVQTIEFLPGYSTSNIIQKIKSLSV
jgi:rfaE bifunctional protein nucleotidyltransferase chain/domain